MGRRGTRGGGSLGDEDGQLGWQEAARDGMIWVRAGAGLSVAGCKWWWMLMRMESEFRMREDMYDHRWWSSREAGDERLGWMSGMR